MVDVQGTKGTEERHVTQPRGVEVEQSWKAFRRKWSISWSLRVIWS